MNLREPKPAALSGMRQSQDDTHWPVTILRICCALALCLGSAAVAPRVSANAASIATCKTDLARHLRERRVPGLAAAIVKDGRIVCTAAAGMANIKKKIPVTRDTLFLVASVSKTITATALMQLYEQGKFQLDDDVNKYLPFKVRIPASATSPITFRQLLTHTASIKDNFTYVDKRTLGADSPISLAKFVKGYFSPRGAYYNKAKNFQSAAPGTINEYANMGIVLAGYLVEVISGMPFDRYCQKKIFKPLGMDTTSWRLANIDRSILAMPYEKSQFGFAPAGQYGEPNYPDGMLRTSVVELAHFLIMYMQGGSYDGRRILRSVTVREMLKSQTSHDRSQGLVWYRNSFGKRSVWGHNGADVGANAEMWMDLKRKKGVILMTNGEWGHEVEDALIARLFREADRY